MFEFWEKDGIVTEEEAMETAEDVLELILKERKECFTLFLFFKKGKLSLFVPSNFEEQQSVVKAAIGNVDKICFTAKVGLKDGEFPSIFYYDVKTKKKFLKVYNVIIVEDKVELFQRAVFDDYDFGWALGE